MTIRLSIASFTSKSESHIGIYLIRNGVQIPNGVCTDIEIVLAPTLTFGGAIDSADTLGNVLAGFLQMYRSPEIVKSSFHIANYAICLLPTTKPVPIFKVEEFCRHMLNLPECQMTIANLMNKNKLLTDKIEELDDKIARLKKRKIVESEEPDKRQKSDV